MRILIFLLSISIIFYFVTNFIDFSNNQNADTATSTPPSNSLKDKPSLAPIPAIVSPTNYLGNPFEQAASASVAFTSDKPLTRISALVGALGASGVPVVNSEGKAVNGTGSDPLGLPWMHVVGVSVTNPNFSISFADATRLLDLGLDPVPPPDSRKAVSLLAAIREGLSSTNPQIQFFSSLIENSNTRLGGPSLALTSTTPEQVRVDMATLEVFMGRIMRLVLIEALRIKASEKISNLDDKKITYAWINFSPLMVRNSHASSHMSIGGLTTLPDSPVKTETPPINCTDDGMNGWGIWLLSKGLGGVDLTSIGGEGAAWQGVADWVVKNIIQSGEKITIDTAKLIHANQFLGMYAGIMTNVLSALNYLFEVAMLHATASMKDGEPLIRHKKKSDGDGEAKIIVVKVEMKMPIPPNSMLRDIDPQTNQLVGRALNCLLALGTAFGNNTFMPTEGPQAGLRVDISGGTGFTVGLDPGNSIVLFGPTRFEPYQDTDANGEIQIPVQGRRQKRDYPDNATPVKKKFGIILTSTLEPTDGTSVGKTFLDSLICVGSVGLGCTDALTDIFKTFHYSLGEHIFSLRDWGSGWAIDDTVKRDGYTTVYKGVNCQSEKGPWNIKFDISGLDLTGQGNISLTFRDNSDSFTEMPLSTKTSYVWDWQTRHGNGGGDGSDEATLTPTKDGYTIKLKVQDHCSWTSEGKGCGYGAADGGPDEYELKMRPATSSECSN